MLTLFRIVRARQFTIDDVRSNLARCKPRRQAELINIALWSGISMYDSPESAGVTARKHRIGTQLARFDLPDDDRRVAFGPKSQSGHVSVWGCEDVLASYFVGVLPIP